MKARFIQPQVNTVGLIGHWKLYEGSAFDYSLRGHNGTLTGTTLTYRYPGLDLEGTNEHIVIDDHVDFTPGGTPLSISVWVFMHEATDLTIASKGVYNTNAEWRFVLDGSDKARFDKYDESVDDCRIGRRYTVALTAYENTWIHLVATDDGGRTPTSMKIYLNGTRIDNDNSTSNPGSFDAVENLTADVHIGRYDTDYANSLIDDVMIFNVEKSAAEIKSIYEITRRRYGV